MACLMGDDHLIVAEFNEIQILDLVGVKKPQRIFPTIYGDDADICSVCYNPNDGSILYSAKNCIVLIDSIRPKIIAGNPNQSG